MRFFCYLCRNCIIMRRTLLIIGLLTAIAVMNGQEVPAVYPGLAFRNISPNGKYAISDSGIQDPMTIIDFEHLKDYIYIEEYAGGSGNNISNTGVVVGYKAGAEEASYWQNGEWHSLPVPTGAVLSYANGITPDGSRIVGDISPTDYAGDYEGTMVVPCYWDLQSDGSYSGPYLLPYPTKDYTERSPQYVTCVRVSEDGKTIAGQIRDYHGMLCQPVVYMQAADGKWSYKLLLEELYYPSDLILPPFPGDGPDPIDWMSPEEREAYNRAVAIWEVLGNDNYDTYPEYEEYMTPEEIEAYNEVSLKWQEEYSHYDEILNQLENRVPAFDYNNVFLSSDGKKYASTTALRFKDEVNGLNIKEYTPYIIDIQSDTYKSYPAVEGLNIMLSSLCDDGTLLGQWNDENYGIFNGYILPAGTTEFIPFYDYVKENDPTLASWMETNMGHKYIYYDPETLMPSTENIIATGIPFSTPDMSYVVFAQYNFWGDDSDPDYYYGYMIGMEPLAGVETITGEYNNDGVYRVYNLQGLKIIETKDSSDINILPKGIYIVNGKKVKI